MAGYKNGGSYAEDVGIKDIKAKTLKVMEADTKSKGRVWDPEIEGAKYNKRIERISERMRTDEPKKYERYVGDDNTGLNVSRADAAALVQRNQNLQHAETQNRGTVSSPVLHGELRNATAGQFAKKGHVPGRT